MLRNGTRASLVDRSVVPQLVGAQFAGTADEWVSDDTLKRQLHKKRREIQNAKAPGAKKFPILASVVLDQRFELLISTLVVANSFTMGVSAEIQLGRYQSYTSLIAISEHIFTSIFVVELVARLFIFGYKSYLPCGPSGSLFNFFDALLVWITGVCVTWLLPLAGTPDSHSWRTFTMLRACRMMRLVRVIHKLPFFHEVWLLLRGLSESMSTLLWTISVMFFLTYIFSVFGVVSISVNLKQQLESTEDPSRKAAIQKLYSMMDSVPNMMFTLTQFLTLDSWNDVARPLRKYVVWSSAFFYTYMSMAVFVLMNLVTAIIVENALALSASDQEQVCAARQKHKHDELLQIKRLFGLIDLDSNDAITFQEFDSAFKDPRLAAKLEYLGMQHCELAELFRLFDTGDGSLDLTEFYGGLAKMDGLANSKGVFMLGKNVEYCLKILEQFTNQSLKDTQVLLNQSKSRCLERSGTLKSRSLASKTARKPNADLALSNKGDTLLPLDNVPAGAKTCSSNLHMESSRISDVFNRLEQAVVGIELCRKDMRNCHRAIQHFSDVGAGCATSVHEMTRRVHELNSESGWKRSLQQRHPDTRSDVGWPFCNLSLRKAQPV